MRSDEASTEDSLELGHDLAFHAAGIGYDGMFGQVFDELGPDRFDGMGR
jgi:hypothetical protein